ncbi:MAG: methionine--tRNA ligase [Acidobacteriota bacterium]|nr:methionine--tRNA ligase [Acidobacteriota bacterium]
MGTFYLSTPIYYVNALPHIGHSYTTIVADAIARYRRLSGDKVFFLTGTDEHGQNILQTAEEKGISAQEQADDVVSHYYELWRDLGISHDDFVRTTEPRHHAGVADIVARIDAADDFYVGKHEGWYCPSCETFYTEKELGADKTCPDHGRPTEWKSEENIFFRLSKYQEPLLDWYRSSPGPVQPATRSNEVMRFVESGLRDLSVSRAGLPWGVPFPGHEGQTVYVWLDALTNYLSALGLGGAAGEAGLLEEYWLSGAGPRVHLVGKDILRFHAVYWPAFLLSAGLPLPTTVWAHGWWLRDQRKVSKSVGNIVQLEPLIDRFGSDPVRYFLLRDMVFGQDASFSDEAFVDRFNSDLANDLGNTVSRLVKLSRTAYDGKTPPEACGDNPIKSAAEEAVKGYREAMDGFAFHKALSHLWRLLSEVNQYLVAREPWKSIGAGNTDSSVSRVLWNGLEGVRIVATGLLPVMPQVAQEVLAAVGTTDVPSDLSALEWGRTPLSVPLPESPQLFPRVDKKVFFSTEPDSAAVAKQQKNVGEEEMTDEITIDKFFETQLKVGTVTAAAAIPKAKKLLKIAVDLGEDEDRQLVAGVAEHYDPEDLVGKQIVVVANLKPVKLMGVESRGMMLAGSADGRPILIHPDSAVPPGTPVK